MILICYFSLIGDQLHFELGLEHWICTSLDVNFHLRAF